MTIHMSTVLTYIHLPISDADKSKSKSKFLVTPKQVKISSRQVLRRTGKVKVNTQTSKVRNQVYIHNTLLGRE